MAEAKWYVVHTYSGHENKVKVNIEKIAENRDLQDLIIEVKIPIEKVVEVKDGKKKTKERKIFPSYAMIKMVMTDETWYIVRNTKGVTGFVGSATKPTPLSDAEVYSMGLENKVIEIDVKVGENIRIISGPFDGFIGEVVSIDEHNQIIKVKINVFGRETPAELTFNQIAKI